MNALAIVPTYLRTPHDLEVFMVMVESLRATEPDLDLFVIDDGSPPEAQPLLDEIDAASSRLRFEVLRKEENEGFSRTVNVGLKRARDENRDAILVNADIKFMDEGWAQRMEATVDPDGEPAAVVGALLLYPNNLIQHAGVYFSLLHRCFDHIYKYAPYDLPEAQHKRVCPVTGALQFIRADTLQVVGVYDENFRMGWEDVDYCVRVFIHGRKCVYNPAVRAFHFESLFRGRKNAKVEDWTARSWLYFMQKWRSQSFADFVPSLI